MEFTSSKSVEPIRDMELQKRQKRKIENKQEKVFRMNLNEKRCLLVPEIKLCRSWVRGKQSLGRKFESLAVQGKKLLT